MEYRCPPKYATRYFLNQQQCSSVTMNKVLYHWIIQFSIQNENIMLTVSPLVFFLTDARFAHLFETKLTKVGPRFTKSHSMIQDYPVVMTTAHARSAIECSLLCEAYATFCNRIHFAGHNADDNCVLLMWNGFWRLDLTCRLFCI